MWENFKGDEEWVQSSLKEINFCVRLTKFDFLGTVNGLRDNFLPRWFFGFDFGTIA